MNESDQKVLQENLVQFLVKDVFKTISPDDLLRIEAKSWTHKGIKMHPDQVNSLKAQAQEFKDSLLWRILKAELAHVALENGFEKSQTAADQIAAKMLVYLTVVVDKKLRTMLD